MSTSSFQLATYSAIETIKILSTYLTHVLSLNDKKADLDGRAPTRFHARTLPAIDIPSYLTRILKYAPAGTECFLAIIIYLERVSVNGLLCYEQLKKNEEVVVVVGDGLSPTASKESTSMGKLESHLAATKLSEKKDIVIDSFNIHRLLITSALVSIKFLSDVFYTNLHVSRVGGVPLNELNQMELEFLKMADFNLMVTPDQLRIVGEKLLQFSLTYRAGTEMVLSRLITLPPPSAEDNSSSSNPPPHIPLSGSGETESTEKDSANPLTPETMIYNSEPSDSAIKTTSTEAESIPLVAATSSSTTLLATSDTLSLPSYPIASPSSTSFLTDSQPFSASIFSQTPLRNFSRRIPRFLSRSSRGRGIGGPSLYLTSSSINHNFSPFPNTKRKIGTSTHARQKKPLPSYQSAARIAALFMKPCVRCKSTGRSCKNCNVLKRK